MVCKTESLNVFVQKLQDGSVESAQKSEDTAKNFFEKQQPKITNLEKLVGSQPSQDLSF